MGILRRRSSHLLTLAACACIALSGRHADASELRWDAKRLFNESTTRRAVLSADGRSIVLQRGVLYEDDGPAAGYSYKPNTEELVPGVRIRKSLIVQQPAADNAVLLVARGGKLQGTINGKPVPLNRPRKHGNYWQEYDVPPKLLRAGRNEIVLSGSGQVWIARDDEFAAGSRTRSKHPNRSAKSTDGGKTWDDARLGTDGNIDGEYSVRLFLDQHHAAGMLTLPVIDVGNLSGTTVAPPVSKVGPVRIVVGADTGESGGIELRVRSGSTWAPQEKHWSRWQTLGPEGVLHKPAGRFLQIGITLRTADPRSSPKLTSVAVEAKPTIGNDWTKRLTVVRNENPTIVRSSIPFRYEPFDHPRLKRFRREHELDKVVKNAKSEFELIQRLAVWSSQRWQKGHLRDGYPAWDAAQILKPHSDGTPVGGFCQQYNVVFLQACESFGLVGRAVSLGPGTRMDRFRSGHEVVEIWSNEFRKWVYVDGNFALYAVDEKSKKPLSLLELRDRQLAALARKRYPFVRIVRLTDRRSPLKSLTERIPFVEMRLIPRSNFLEEKSPLPLNQGMRGWFWTGHYVWTDAAAPARRLYGRRIEKRNNWNWMLNQTAFRLEATDRPGVLGVHLDTETPEFKTFLAKIDGQRARAVSSGFLWNLNKGNNTLELWSRNNVGRDGSRSRVAVVLR